MAKGRKPLAATFAAAGEGFLGTPYSRMDCQALCEAMLREVGLRVNLRGSNAWWRRMTWRGTPEACVRRFGRVPPGAFLFILAEDGGEVARGYHDGLGNASHMGVATGRGKGAVHASEKLGRVAESAFTGRSIPGGWNRVGLWDALDYGEDINRLLTGGTDRKKEVNGLKSETAELAMVVCPDGETVRLRAAPDTKAAVLRRLPRGTQVEILGVGDRWHRVRWREDEGWMMSSFLTPLGLMTTEERVEALEKRVEALEAKEGRG